ncbi:MAG: hypothetical protein ACPGRX_04195 [Bdellovibrionales bacterium]
MSDAAETQLPKVELATKEWVSREDIDTERRIEKAFHEQTQYMMQQFNTIRDEMNSRFTSVEDKLNGKIDSQTRWMVGLIMTMTFAILAAVLFK